HTNFLNEQRLLDRPNEQPHSQHLQDALIAAGLHALDDALSPSNPLISNPWKTLGPWRMVGEARTVTYRYQEQEHHVALRPRLAGAGTWNVQVDSQPAEDVTYQAGNDDLVLLRHGARQVRAYVQQIEGQTQVMLDGLIYRLERRQPPDVDAAAHGGSAVQAQRTLNAPMAGTVVKVLVADGAQVQQQQVLVILSAMKMEHTITAPADGIVRRVHYKEGDVVKGGAVVVEME
nr:3-methylcrotonyl-CoA carboxylase [Ktedonobacteraceae bacterium]